jgi:hypothetical protein
VQNIQWTRIECNRHEPLGQIFRFSLCARQASFCLANSVSKSSSFCPCRSYLCVSGGYG